MYDLTEWEGVPLGMFYWRARGKTFSRAYLRDGTVLRVEIDLDYDLTLGETVDKYGPPESVYAYVGRAESLWQDISFDYPSIGFTVDSYSLINPEDIAGAAVFLASPASDFVNGVTLPVDGGWMAW